MQKHFKSIFEMLLLSNTINKLFELNYWPLVSLVPPYPNATTLIIFIFKNRNTKN